MKSTSEGVDGQFEVGKTSVSFEKKDDQISGNINHEDARLGLKSTTHGVDGQFEVGKTCVELKNNEEGLTTSVNHGDDALGNKSANNVLPLPPGMVHTLRKQSKKKKWESNVCLD